MNDILIGIFILALAVATFVWLQFQRQRRRTEAGVEAQAMLAACNQLLALLEHLQQHRGMSSAWLAGDKSFEGRMRIKREAIEAVFPRLQAAIALESGQPCPCLTANEVNGFRTKWRALIEDLQGLSAEESIATHSQLIGHILIWLSDLGEARIELPASGRVPHGLVRNYAYRLPNLSECLGQARAIGSSVAARHTCSPVARVRLLFLLTRAEELLGQAYDGGGNQAAGQQASRAVAILAATIRTEMLGTSTVSIAADAYFNAATQAIDAVYQWIKSCGRVLEEDLVPDASPTPMSANLAYAASAS